MLDKEYRIKAKKQLNHFLTVEKERYAFKGFFSAVKIFFEIGEYGALYKHQVLLRKAEYYTNINKKLLGAYYRLRLSKIQNKYSIHIPLNCCDYGLKIMHVGSVLMNGDATVGKNCTFHINTALVANGHSDLAPKVGDNVIFGIGSIALGNISLAEGIVVGANSVVNKTFTEEYISIAGSPAKKISNNGADTWGGRKE